MQCMTARTSVLTRTRTEWVKKRRTRANPERASITLISSEPADQQSSEAGIPLAENRTTWGRRVGTSKRASEQAWCTTGPKKIKRGVRHGARLKLQLPDETKGWTSVKLGLNLTIHLRGPQQWGLDSVISEGSEGSRRNIAGVRACVPGMRQPMR